MSQHRLVQATVEAHRDTGAVVNRAAARRDGRIGTGALRVLKQNLSYSGRAGTALTTGSCDMGAGRIG